MFTFESEFELEVVAIKKSYLFVNFIKMTNAKNNKKLGNATIRNQKQNERKKELRNVIKISKTISKLKNEKIKKKLSSKAKKATEKKKN